MIMNHKKNYLEDTLWERLEVKTKLILYSIMQELLQAQGCTPFIYKIILLLEFLQILYYTLNLQYHFVWSASVIQYFMEIIQYFQINSLIQDGNSTLFLTILYAIFSILLFIVLLLLFLAFKLGENKKQKNRSSFLTYTIKIVSIYGLLHNTILVIPFYNCFFSVLICHSDQQVHSDLPCYNGIYFVHLMIAFIGLIILSLISVVFIILMIDLNPSSTVPYASPQTKINIMRIGLKIFLPIFVSIDYSMSLGREFVTFLLVIYSALLVQRLRIPQCYDKSIANFILIGESTILWITLCIIVHAYTNKDVNDENTGAVFSVFGIVIVSALSLLIIQERNIKYLQMNTKEFRSDSDIEMYINICIDLVEEKHKATQRIKLEGLLRYHQKKCTRVEQCYCWKMVNPNLLEADDEAKDYRKWYQFLNSIVQEGLEKFPKSPRLHLLQSYITMQKLKNKYKALFELMVTEDQKPNIQEEFSVYRFKCQVEEDMKEYDTQINEEKGIDVNIIVHFQDKFVFFQNAIDRSVQLHMEFWMELLEENPDIHKLQDLGSRITLKIEETKSIFKDLSSINPSRIKMLDIYSSFLKEIVNDDQEGQKIMERKDYIFKSAQVNKQFIDTDRLKYGENCNTCIIQVSGNFNTLGVITSTNDEIFRITGYPKVELIDQNISKIMPKIQADIHDNLMKKYLESTQGKVINKERFVLCLNKQGYLVPCTLMIKVMSNLDEGIQIVGFLSHINDNLAGNVRLQLEGADKTHYMIYNPDNEQLLGVTYSCYENMGIPASLVSSGNNTQELTIDQLAPEILDQNNHKELISSNGLILTIDTTAIQQNFLLEEEEDQKQDEYNEEVEISHDISVEEPLQSAFNKTLNKSLVNTSKITQKQSKFKKTKCKVFIVEENVYGDIKMNIIKCVEIEEGSETDILNKSKKLEMEQNKKTIDQNQKLIDQKQVEDDEQREMQEIDNDKEKEEQKFEEQNSVGQSNLNESQVSALNEDMRHLSDFKQMISEKTVPKSVRILQKTVFLLLLMLCIISGVQLSLKVSQNNTIDEGVTAINQAYLRHNTMVDISYYSRKIWALANGLINYDSNATLNNIWQNEKDNLDKSLFELQLIQFEVIKSNIKMEQRLNQDEKNQKLYSIKSLLQNGDVKTEEQVFTDSIFQFITSASSLTNSSLQAFQKTDDAMRIFHNIEIVNQIESNKSIFIVSTAKNFYFVRENGLLTLRAGSEDLAQQFFDYYSNLTNSFDIDFQLLMIIAIIFLILSQFVLIPIVFNVHKTNNKVLSLFAIIPLIEIKELAVQCERFTETYIKSNQKTQQIEMKQDVNANAQAQVNIQNEPNKNLSNVEIDNEPREQEQQENQKQGTLQIPVPTQIQQQKDKSTLQVDVSKINNNSISQNQTIKLEEELINNEQNQKEKKKQQKIDDDKQEEKEEQEEVEIERLKKLLNSKDKTKNIAIPGFALVTMIFIIYFAVDYSLEVTYLNNISQILQQLKLVCQRPSLLKYTVMFTLEEICMGQKLYENQQELQSKFTQDVYQNERDIFSSFLLSYPSQFDSYKNLFEKVNQNSVCENSESASKNKDKCKAVQGGILDNGLRTSIVTLSENTRDLLVDFRGSNMSITSKIYELNNQQFINTENMKKYIVNVIMELDDLLLQDINLYLNDTGSVEEIKFSIFIIFLFIVFIVIWTPYLQSLNYMIWRTKGMLNMIPMVIITKHDKLKQAFLHGDILQAVR